MRSARFYIKYVCTVACPLLYKNMYVWSTRFLINMYAFCLFLYKICMRSALFLYIFMRSVLCKLVFSCIQPLLIIIFLYKIHVVKPQKKYSAVSNRISVLYMPTEYKNIAVCPWKDYKNIAVCLRKEYKNIAVCLWKEYKNIAVCLWKEYKNIGVCPWK